MQGKEMSFDAKAFSEMIYGVRNPLEKIKEIFSMNNGPAARTIIGSARDIAIVFIEILQALESGRSNELKSYLSNDDIRIKKIYEVYKVDIDLIVKVWDIDGDSYENIVQCFYDSIIHNNLALSYAMLRIMNIKINRSRKLYFSDYKVIQGFLYNMKQTINYDQDENRYHGNLEELVREYPILIDTYCKIARSTTGGVWYSNEDIFYVGSSKYNYNGKLNLELLKNDFETAQRTSNLRSIIYELDNYANSRYTQRDSKVWEYLLRSLLLDFAANGKIDWNIELSKDLLMCFCRLSIELNEGKACIIEYNNQINNLIYICIGILDNIINAGRVGVNKDASLQEIANFLFNLYELFPLENILDYIDILSLLINEKWRKWIIDYLETLRVERLGNNKWIEANTQVNYGKTIIEDIVICLRNKAREYIIVEIYIKDLDEDFDEVELNLYDNEGRLVRVGNQPKESIRIIIPRDVRHEGLVILNTTILGVCNVSRIGAKLVNSSSQFRKSTEVNSMNKKVEASISQDRLLKQRLNKTKDQDPNINKVDADRISSEEKNNLNQYSTMTSQSNNNHLTDLEYKPDQFDAFKDNQSKDKVSSHSNKWVIIGILILGIIAYQYSANQSNNEYNKMISSVEGEKAIGIVRERYTDNNGIEYGPKYWVEVNKNSRSIYGWTSSHVENDIWFVSYEYDFDTERNNGYKSYSFEVKINNRIVKKITGVSSLETKYRDLGFIE